MQFAKDLERFKLFFMEDPLPPEDITYFRQNSPELCDTDRYGRAFQNPHEWQPLMSELLTDYIRGHVSQVGGLTPARKIAILAENLGVRTA